jgi:hypothetical protein
MRDHMDPVLGRELERVFTDSPEPRRTSAPKASARQEPRWRTALVTAVVGVLVAGTAAVAIQTVRPDARPAVGPTPTATARATPQDPLLAVLPKQPYGRTMHTWTDQDATNPSGPFDVTGSTVVIAGVCEGGGAISITAPGRPPHRLGCAKRSVQQPFWRFNLGGDGKPTKETGPVRVTVKVLSGSPRFIVRMWAVDPRILDANHWSIAATSSAVPRSLRTCTAADLASTGTFDPLAARSGGVVTIRSRSADDCAIRSWPTLQYRAADGSRVGPVQGRDENGRSLDSSEGALNKYGEFPPARLTAGGEAFLIADLRTEAELQRDDDQARQQRATPAPSTPAGFAPPLCRPRRIAAMELGIGAARVSVPLPSSPAPAACTSDAFSFGVNPVVAERPSGEQ